MREEDTCQILPVSASQAHLRERDEALPSPHCFQFQIHHSHALPAAPAHPGLEKTIQMVLKLLSAYTVWKKDSSSKYSTSRIKSIYPAFLKHTRSNVHNDSNLQQQAILFFFSKSWPFLVTWAKYNFMQISSSNCYTATTNCRYAAYGCHRNALVTSCDFITVSVNRGWH